MDNAFGECAIAEEGNGNVPCAPRPMSERASRSNGNTRSDDPVRTQHPD
jgi:hypothetical protein